jgi:hypothetical protein
VTSSSSRARWSPVTCRRLLSSTSKFCSHIRRRRRGRGIGFLMGNNSDGGAPGVEGQADGVRAPLQRWRCPPCRRPQARLDTLYVRPLPLSQPKSLLCFFIMGSCSWSSGFGCSNRLVNEAIAISIMTRK